MTSSDNSESHPADGTSMLPTSEKVQSVITLVIAVSQLIPVVKTALSIFSKKKKKKSKSSPSENPEVS
jgi:hypothetical protein